MHRIACRSSVKGHRNYASASKQPKETEEVDVAGKQKELNLAGWAHFLKLNKPGLQRENPNAEYKEIVKLASARWKNLPEHWRGAYISEAANLTGAAIHDPHEPKKHTAWQIFLKDEMEKHARNAEQKQQELGGKLEQQRKQIVELKRSMGTTKSAQKTQFASIVKEIAEKWNARSPEVDQQYKARAQEDYNRWVKEEKDYRLLYSIPE